MSEVGRENFKMVVDSGNYSSVYPKNKPGKFMFKLPRPLRNVGKMSVSVNHFVTTTGFFNIPETEYITVYHSSDGINFKKCDEIAIYAAYYADCRTLVNSINSCLHQYLNSTSLAMVEIDGQEKPQIHFNSLYDDCPLMYVFSPALQQKMGFSHSQVSLVNQYKEAVDNKCIIASQKPHFPGYAFDKLFMFSNICDEPLFEFGITSLRHSRYLNNATYLPLKQSAEGCTQVCIYFQNENGIKIGKDQGNINMALDFKEVL
jgi:hypothetical protein